jgi:hypothetical protein
MGRFDSRYAIVPWGWLLPSDVCEANNGEPELQRDCRIEGHQERQYGLHVWGQSEPCPPSLGIIALRCEVRSGGVIVPMTLSIPDTPIVFERRAPQSPVLMLAQSNPRRDEQWPDRESD